MRSCWHENMHCDPPKKCFIKVKTASFRVYEKWWCLNKGHVRTHIVWYDILGPEDHFQIKLGEALSPIYSTGPDIVPYSLLDVKLNSKYGICQIPGVLAPPRANPSYIACKRSVCPIKTGTKVVCPPLSTTMKIWHYACYIFCHWKISPSYFLWDKWAL